MGKIVIEDAHCDRWIQAIAQCGETPQIGEQYRHLSPRRDKFIPRVGQSLNYVGWRKPLELALQPFQLIFGSQQQSLELTAAPVMMKAKRTKAQQDEHHKRCQPPDQVSYSSSIASRTVAFASAATPMASNSAVLPKAPAKVRVFCWIVDVS